MKLEGFRFKVVGLDGLPNGRGMSRADPEDREAESRSLQVGRTGGTASVTRTNSAIEPLEPTIWFKRFRLVEERTIVLEGRSPEQLLRHVFHLTQLTPGPLKHLLSVEVSESAMEGFLDCQAYDSAAMALAGDGIDYSITRSAGVGVITVALRVGSGHPPVHATSDRFSTAFLLAYCGCMRSLLEGAHSDAFVSRPLQQTSLIGVDRAPSTH